MREKNCLDDIGWMDGWRVGWFDCGSMVGDTLPKPILGLVSNKDKILSFDTRRQETFTITQARTYGKINKAQNPF